MGRRLGDDGGLQTSPRLMTEKRTFRTIADLAKVPEAELTACLASLHRGLVEARRQHAAALREGLIAPDAPFEFEAFTWKPKGGRSASTSVIAEGLGPETPIRELPVRPRVQFVLHQRNIFCLEDLSAISEHELLCGDGVGVKTVGRLREMLAAIGLAFQPNPDARGRAFEESRSLRAMPEPCRAEALLGLADDAPLSHLALRPMTMRRAQRAGFKTVGELRSLNPPNLAGRFGPSERREIYERLIETGRVFREAYPPSDLWRYGLIDRASMTFPVDPETPLVEVRPWLGGAYRVLKRHFRELGALRVAAECGQLSDISGIGPHTARQLAAVLGIQQPATATAAEGAPPQNELWKVLSQDLSTRGRARRRRVL